MPAIGGFIFEAGTFPPPKADPPYNALINKVAGKTDIIKG